MSNTITAFFKGRIGVCESVYQHDYGLVLILDDIDFGTSFDAYFEIMGEDEAIPAVGQNDRVAIPNSCLANSGMVKLHIPVHSGENDSEVEYVVEFKVIGRAKPVDDGTPADQVAIAQAIAALQEAKRDIPEDLQAYYDSHIAPNIEDDVNDWLDEHPEATTTVADNSLTYKKLVNGTLNFVTPEMYGAEGDGSTDDTSAINSAMQTGMTVLFSQKIYKCANVLVENKNNIALIGNGATLFFPNGTDNKKWLSFVECSNVYIENLNFNGNRANQTLKSSLDGVDAKDLSENCPAILFDGCNNCVVSKCTFTECQADGVQIDKLYYDQDASASNISSDIRIADCIFDAVGRNGVSVVHAEKVSIENCTFKNIQLFSTSIACGIDAEPNPVVGFICRDINITNCLFDNCVWGVNLTANGENPVMERISVNNNNIHNCNIGFQMLISNGKNIDVHDNIVTSCLRGLRGQGLIKGLSFINNDITNMLANNVGIQFNYLENAIILANRIDSTGGYGISIVNGNTITIKENVITGDNASGAHIHCDAATNVIVKNNRFLGNKATCIIESGSGNQFVDNTVDSHYSHNVSGGLVANNKETLVNESINFSSTAANTLEYTGISVSIPANSEFNLLATLSYQNTMPKRIAIMNTSSSYSDWSVFGDGVGRASVSGYTTTALTLYVWVSTDGAGSNKVALTGIVKS